MRCSECGAPLESEYGITWCSNQECEDRRQDRHWLCSVGSHNYDTNEPTYAALWVCDMLEELDALTSEIRLDIEDWCATWDECEDLFITTQGSV